jgi:hypothetical protein
MEIPAALISVFPPSPELLLNLVRRLVDDAMLEDVAKADYGEKADEMLKELQLIRDAGIISNPMHGQLIEVLELTCWSDPDKPNSPPFEPGPSGPRGHLTRLFAGAVLLRASYQVPSIQSNRSNNDSILAHCLVSAGLLGNEMTVAMGSFLTWLLLQIENHGEKIFFILGLLIVTSRLESDRIANSVLGDVAREVLVQESFERKAFAWSPDDPQPSAFSVLHGLWQQLVVELRNRAATIPEEDIRTDLELCASYLEMY